MAHARRKFADSIKISRTNGLAHEALKIFKALYKIESQVREYNLSPLDRFAIRDKHATPILTAFKTWLSTNLTKTPVFKVRLAMQYVTQFLIGSC